MCSHLARSSEVYFDPLRELFTPSCLGSLLLQLNSSVRAKTCNLIGNLCRHSSSWYSILLQPVRLQPTSARSPSKRRAQARDRGYEESATFGSLLSLLIHCCADADDSTRKFACFAGIMCFIKEAPTLRLIDFCPTAFSWKCCFS